MVLEELKLAVSIGAAILSAIALLISWRAMRVAREVRTSDFQAVEEVKSQTAALLAAMRSAMVKGALANQGAQIEDLATEKKVVSEFAASTTGFAYYAWTAQVSEAARQAGKEGEPWRLFWIHLAEMSQTDSAIALGASAAHVEVLFDGLSANDLRSIASRMGDLPDAITEIIASRKHDSLLGPFIEVYVEEPERRRRGLPQMLSYLRAQGVNDPDVDLLLASSTGDLEMAKRALAGGAKLNVGDSEIMRRYAEQLKGFVPPDDDDQ